MATKPEELKDQHRVAVEELNRASVHVADATKNAVTRLQTADPSRANISALRKLRHQLETTLEAIDDLAAEEKK